MPTENEKPARTPLPDGPSKPAVVMEAPPKPATQIKESQDSHESEIQVPSTPREFKNSGQEETPAKPHNIESGDVPSDDRTETTEDGDREVVDPDAELPAIDWAEFELRYTKAIDEANKVEDGLFNQFDDLVTVISDYAEIRNMLTSKGFWRLVQFCFQS